MEISNTVTLILSELSGTENICLEHELQNDLGLDSFQMVVLLITLEDRFHIVLDESDMNPLDLTSGWDIVSLKKYVGGEGHEEKN